MFWFKKKDKGPEQPQQQSAVDTAGTDEGGEESEEQKPAISGNIEAELTKIKSSLDALNEIRKANSEQFTRLSEQIGELRGALMDTNKAVGTIEVASTRAIDMVNSVQPDKLMIEVRKTDGKVEALRANIEANETIMKDMMKEMKEMRAQMTFYKGVDQVVKMNNEIKQELIDIKKTEGLVGRHADRVETIFVEVEKKFYDFEKFNEAVKEIERSFKKIATDFDKIRVGVDEKADKKEFVKMVDKFSDFEKHTTNILKLLDQKSKNTVVELNNAFDSLRKQLEKRYDKKIDVKGLTVEEQAAQATATGPAGSVADVKAEVKPADVKAVDATNADIKPADAKVEVKPADVKSSASAVASGDADINTAMNKIKGLFEKKSEAK